MPFHMVSNRLIDGSRVSMDGSVLESDFDGQFKLEAPGLTVVTRVILLDGVVWMLDPTFGWYQAESADVLEPINPLVRAFATVEYSRPFQRGDQALHVLRSTEWTGSPFSGLREDLEVIGSTLELFVTDAGVPLDGSLEYAASGSAFGMDDYFESARTNYVFSRVGEPVRIHVPEEGSFAKRG